MAKIVLPNMAQVNFGTANALLSQGIAMQQGGVQGLGDTAVNYTDALQKSNFNALEKSMQQAKTVEDFNNPEFQQGLSNQLASYGRWIDQGEVNKALDSRPVTLAEQQTKLRAEEYSRMQFDDNNKLARLMPMLGTDLDMNRKLIAEAGLQTADGINAAQSYMDGNLGLKDKSDTMAYNDQRRPIELASAQFTYEKAKAMLPLEMQKMSAEAQKAWIDNKSAAMNLAVKAGTFAEEYPELAAQYGDFMKSLPGMSGSGGGGGTAISGKAQDYAKIIYDRYRTNGMSHNQAASLVAEHGRENDFNPAYMFGTHYDAANKKSNLGILSWQGGRDKDLINFMKQRGVWDGNGKMPQTKEALEAQVDFASQEMQKYGRTKNSFLSNANISQQDAAVILGDDYIRWDRAGKTLGKDLPKHLQKRDNYYKMAMGFGNGGAGGEASLAAARDRATGRTGDPNKKQPAKVRATGARLANLANVNPQTTAQSLMSTAKVATPKAWQTPKMYGGQVVMPTQGNTSMSLNQLVKQSGGKGGTMPSDPKQAILNANLKESRAKLGTAKPIASEKPMFNPAKTPNVNKATSMETTQQDLWKMMGVTPEAYNSAPASVRKSIDQQAYEIQSDLSNFATSRSNEGKKFTDFNRGITQVASELKGSNEGKSEAVDMSLDFVKGLRSDANDSIKTKMVQAMGNGEDSAQMKQMLANTNFSKLPDSFFVEFMKRGSKAASNESSSGKATKAMALTLASMLDEFATAENKAKVDYLDKTSAKYSASYRKTLEKRKADVAAMFQ